MKFKVLVATSVVASALALPGVASAKGSVSSDLRSADRALDRAQALVANGRASSAVIQLRSSDRATRRAYRRAANASSPLSSVRGLKAVAANEQDRTEELAALLDNLSGRVQALVASTLERAMQLKERILTRITTLIDELPEAKRTGVVNWMVGFAPQVSEVVDSLLNGAEAGEFSSVVEATVSDILDFAVETVKDVVSHVESVVGVLPAPVAATITSMLEQIKVPVMGAVSVVTDLIDTVFQTVGGVQQQVSGVIGQVMQVISGILGGGEVLNGLPFVSGLLGTGDDAQSGASVPPTRTGGFLGGLLDSILGSLPFLGGSGSGNLLGFLNR